MNNQTLLIYDFDYLFEILIELRKELNLNVVNVSKKELSTWYFGENSTFITMYLDENIRYEGRSIVSKKNENTKKVLKLVFSISMFPSIKKNLQ